MQADRHARSSAVARPDALVGRLLDHRYRIGEQIARGGMATVYVARDERLQRTVALKVMHTGLGDDEVFTKRFVGEARAAAGLTHPNVVAVYDQGDDHGTLFLAMELVRGETLRDVIAREAPLPPATALAYLEPVLAALAAAHRAGLVHRDVKPENVLIRARRDRDEPLASRVKVADFGLARAITSQTQHTASGVIIGTVSYLAPELVVNGRSDARADVYSAGVLLYELLTGRKPHAGETPIQVAYKHVHEDVPAPSRLVPTIPAYVDALVARATARDRDLRPADAGVFLHQAQLVARALAQGVSDDPDLVADLMPGGLAAAPQRTALLDRPGSDTAPTPRPAAPAPALPTPTPHRQSPPQRTRRRWPAVLALLLAAVVALGAIGVAERDKIPFLNSVTVPGVANDTTAGATTHLQDAGLVVAATRQTAYSDTVKAGAVIGTDPAAGAHAHHGDTVTLVISRGIEQYPLPAVAGKSQAEATAALQAVKLSITTTPVWSGTVGAGQAIRTDPAAGTVLRPGHAVTLYISKGPQPVTVAAWQGKSAAAAKRALTKQGLKVTVTRQYDDQVPQGMVISESPDQTHTFHKGDTITLTVSRGPHLVRVPTNLAGHDQGPVTRALEALGFQVSVQDYSIHFGLGLVMKVDQAGQTVPYGSTITIYVS